MSLNSRNPIHVLVMHAEPLIELGVVAALSAHEDLAVQAGTTQPMATVESAPAVHVVVTDHQNALALLEQRGHQRLSPPLAEARIIVLALQHREPDVRWALENGVAGYMLVRCSLHDLVQGVRAVDRGGRYLCQAAARSVAESLMREALTSRELQVLNYLAHGHCNKQIATDMGVALGTVKAHMKSILGKLGAQSRMQALGIAVVRGLVTELSMPTHQRRRAGQTSV
ncbi:LuxR C-terminal-related transcriptional regulator [Variovorax sp. HJSM1_2]|uniref:LuxR C-terminal-related transcriptional regulator n=1 Tax=Variovorax sp. HJSM1_2 TaxID=3366263 RepID=UPI003BDC2282